MASKHRGEYSITPFEFADDLCKSCGHAKHEGRICNKKVAHLSGDQQTWGTISCQCRVEPPIPNSYKEAWIKTASGLKIHFLNPSPDEIEIEDIAHHLAQKVRYSGACYRPYSVADHCLVGCQIARHLGLGPLIEYNFLMHEAEEFVFPDLPSPMKWNIPQWRSMVAPLECVIADKFDLNRTLMKAEDGYIKEIDRALGRVVEGSVLIIDWEEEPCSLRISSIWGSWVAARTTQNWLNTKREFLSTFFRLRKELGLP